MSGTQIPPKTSPEQPAPVSRYLATYRSILKQYRITGQDPERLPILKKEAELDAWKLELGVRETTEAVCSRLEPLLKSLQSPVIPKVGSASKPARASTRPKSFYERIRAWVDVTEVVRLLTAITFAAGAFLLYLRPIEIPSPRPVIIERLPGAVYYQPVNGVNLFWEGKGLPNTTDGRWVKMAIIKHTPQPPTSEK